MAAMPAAQYEELKATLWQFGGQVVESAFRALPTLGMLSCCPYLLDLSRLASFLWVHT